MQLAEITGETLTMTATHSPTAAAAIKEPVTNSIREKLKLLDPDHVDYIQSVSNLKKTIELDPHHGRALIEIAKEYTKLNSQWQNDYKRCVIEPRSKAFALFTKFIGDDITGPCVKEIIAQDFQLAWKNLDDHYNNLQSTETNVQDYQSLFEVTWNPDWNFVDFENHMTDLIGNVMYSGYLADANIPDKLTNKQTW